MGIVTNLTQQQIDKIQIDEGVVYLNFGESDEQFLAPTRGGGEFVITNTIRDIEFDGKRGKTKGLQAIDDQSATLKVVTLCSSQEILALGILGAIVTKGGVENTIISNPETNDIIGDESYLKNATIFAKLMDGSFKKITIFNPMHEGGFTFKAVSKSENENSLEFVAHFDPKDSKIKLWTIEEVASIPTTEG